tara:strand:+ start:204 stop:986 length:783 start_codon:yes stop_codon:yes gene_type:complete
MSLIQNKYYIVRVGDFATNGNTKLLYGLFSIVLCIDDYISRNSTDCGTILIGSTVIWTFVEFFLHYSKTRIIKPMYITLWNEKIQLSQNTGIIIQGLQEGGLVTTLGLYFGDRLFDMYYMIGLHMFILVAIGNICIKKNIIKSSKRQVNTNMSLSFIGGITIYNIKSLYQYPEHIYRQLAMFSIMVYICSFWTFFLWYKGFRTIEIHIKNTSYAITNTNNSLQPYYKKDITCSDTFYILAYDVFFEIGVAYILFYNLFLI